jgi:hypothetical protein
VVADDLAILRICSGSNQPKQNDKKYSHIRPHLEIRALLLMIVLAARCVSGSQDCEAPAAGLSQRIQHGPLQQASGRVPVTTSL